MIYSLTFIHKFTLNLHFFQSQKKIISSAKGKLHIFYNPMVIQNSRDILMLINSIQ